MTITDDTLREKKGLKMELISFKQFVEELTGAPFEEVYKDYLTKGENDVSAKSDLARFA